jgi:hypothetical protein
MSILDVALALVVFLWFVTLLSELQQKGCRDRWAREDGWRNPSPIKDLYYDMAGTSILLQAGALSIDEVRRYQQAWDECMTRPAIILGKGMRYTRIG